jgi:hypothetical protein
LVDEILGPDLTKDEERELKINIQNYLKRKSSYSSEATFKDVFYMKRKCEVLAALLIGIPVIHEDSAVKKIVNTNTEIEEGKEIEEMINEIEEIVAEMEEGTKVRLEDGGNDRECEETANGVDEGKKMANLYQVVEIKKIGSNIKVDIISFSGYLDAKKAFEELVGSLLKDADYVISTYVRDTKAVIKFVERKECKEFKIEIVESTPGVVVTI